MSFDERSSEPRRDAPAPAGSWVSPNAGQARPERSGRSRATWIGIGAAVIVVMITAGLLGAHVLAPSGEQADDGSGTAEAPGFDEEIDAAADQAALSDARSLAVAIMQRYVEAPDAGPPQLADDGAHYLVDGEESLAVSAGSSLGGFTGTGADAFCVWVVSAGGTPYEARSDGSAGEGSCG